MKHEIHEIVLKAELPSARRKDSQGICFLSKINYNDFVRRFLGEREEAMIELETDKKIGTHHGYRFHTIDQREGLGLEGGPWFVVRRDIQNNIIYVSYRYDADKQYRYKPRMKDFNFITSNPWKSSTGEEDVTLKIRHTSKFIKGRLIQDADGYRTISSERLQGITPGRFGVICDTKSRIYFGSGEIG